MPQAEILSTTTASKQDPKIKALLEKLEKGEISEKLEEADFIDENKPGLVEKSRLFLRRCFRSFGK